MKKKLSSIAGVTLIEILIGILISVVMMGAMFTSYQVVNNTYSQVADRAKISPYPASPERPPPTVPTVYCCPI